MAPTKGPSWHQGTKGHWIQKKLSWSSIFFLEKDLDRKGEMWKLINRNLIGNGVRRTLTYMSLNTHYWAQQEVPCISKEGNTTFHITHRKWYHITTSAGRRKDSSFPSNSSANGRLPLLGHYKSLHFKLSVPANGLFVYNSPFQVHKRASLSFVSLGLCVVHH